MKQFANSRTRLGSISLACAMVLPVSFTAMAEESLTLYTTREPGLIQPLLESWTQSSGIKVDTVYIKDGMLERVKAEGKNSPADLLMAVDVGNLVDLVEAGVTQPVVSDILKAAIPANLRGEDNQWFTLSMRARVLYTEKKCLSITGIMSSLPAHNIKEKSACAQAITLITPR
ncbi:MAG: Iron uptake protein A1 [Candidatus Erwinia impunctatus]|nr:Iron uptake protein A1 [Culicoides impunctatus]